MPPGCDPVRVAESMVELRGYAEEGFYGLHMLGERMVALRLSHSLGFEDMARAARMTVPEARELVRERWEHHLLCQQRRGEALVARHSVAA